MPRDGSKDGKEKKHHKHHRKKDKAESNAADEANDERKRRSSEKHADTKSSSAVAAEATIASKSKESSSKHKRSSGSKQHVEKANASSEKLSSSKDSKRRRGSREIAASVPSSSSKSGHRSKRSGKSKFEFVCTTGFQADSATDAPQHVTRVTDLDGLCDATDRNWNEEWQTLTDACSRAHSAQNAAERVILTYTTSQHMIRFYTRFVHFVENVAMSIVRNLERAEGVELKAETVRHYEFDSIHFSCTNDDATRSLFTSEMRAFRAIARHLYSLPEKPRAYDSSFLSLPLVTLCECFGTSVLCTALMPITRETLTYGTLDNGSTFIGEDGPQSLGELWRSTCERFHLSASGVKTSAGADFYGPIDMQGHKGTDNRLYVLNLAHFLPAFRPSVAIGTDTLPGCCMRAEAISTLDTPLNSNGARGVRCIAHDIEERDTQTVIGVSDRMGGDGMKRLAKYFQTGRGINWLPDVAQNVKPLVSRLHLAGLKLSLLGKLRVNLDATLDVSDLATTVLIEMIARVAREQIRKELRVVKDISAEKSQQVTAAATVIAAWINRYLRVSEENHDLDEFQLELKQLVVQKFGEDALSVEEKAPGHNLFDDMKLSHVVRRMHDVCGFTFNANYFALLDSGREVDTRHIVALDLAGKYLIEGMFDRRGTKGVIAALAPAIEKDMDKKKRKFYNSLLSEELKKFESALSEQRDESKHLGAASEQQQDLLLARVHFNCGLMHLLRSRVCNTAEQKQQEYSAAAKCYTESLRLDFESADCVFCQGQLCYEQSDLETEARMKESALLAAREKHRRAATLDPTFLLETERIAPFLLSDEMSGKFFRDRTRRRSMLPMDQEVVEDLLNHVSLDGKEDTIEGSSEQE